MHFLFFRHNFPDVVDCINLVDIIYTDTQKAFNSVSILAQKIRKYSLSDPLISGISSCLSCTMKTIEFKPP